MTVESRILFPESGARRCETIPLFPEEKAIYPGAGWKIARFQNARLIAFFDAQALPMLDDLDAAIDEACAKALEFVSAPAYEHWLVMCSGYELCEPRKINTDDASAAVLARRMGEVIRALY